MTPSRKFAAFTALVALAFGGAAAVGAAVGPIDVGAQSDATHSTHADDAPDMPRGLTVAVDGYRLVVDSPRVSPGVRTRFGFSILDDDGRPVTQFDELHERRLHLIVLSRNLVDYVHIHPTMDAAGHWSVELPARRPGSYRVFADFRPTGGENLTLGTDITVPGEAIPVAPPAPGNRSEIGGYTVTMAGAPAPGDSELGFTVERAGRRVRTDPYLGAAGHLVAIREGDLAYLHVHPHEDGKTPVVTFTGEFPTAGTYRLFFDFSHRGTVRTASFTVHIDGGH